jgi:hypothetical protein
MNKKERIKHRIDRLVNQIEFNLIAQSSHMLNVKELVPPDSDEETIEYMEKILCCELEKKYTIRHVEKGCDYNCEDNKNCQYQGDESCLESWCCREVPMFDPMHDHSDEYGCVHHDVECEHHKMNHADCKRGNYIEIIGGIPDIRVVDVAVCYFVERLKNHPYIRININTVGDKFIEEISQKLQNLEYDVMSWSKEIVVTDKIK